MTLLTRSVVLSAALLGTAHATPVEVTFNIVNAAQFIGSWVDGAEQRVITSDEPLAPFTMVYRFDTENPLLDTPGTSSTVYVSSIFRQGASSTSPYTAWAMGGLPPASQAIWPLETQVQYGHSITDHDGPTVPQPSWENTGLTTGTRWDLTGETTHETYSYSRGIGWSQQGPMIARQDFHALDASEYIAWLQAQVGKTFEGAYNETTGHSVVRLVDFGGGKLPSGNPQDLLSWSSLGVRGDVVLTSVVAIPEPATSALWAMGALGLLALARRRAQGQA
ncbi:MAG: hypothetical protein RI907_242 [Pseudomonadota bacterium]|jgi:MYXO-CTERM domain-containing protein